MELLNFNKLFNNIITEYYLSGPNIGYEINNQTFKPFHRLIKNDFRA